jgi:parvulin-like peptidyl-prolyl isomerase
MLPNFLVINEEPLSLDQALNYLKADGALQPFLTSILRQHAIAQALANQPDLRPTIEEIEQQLEQFRQNNKLLEAEQFQQWLEYSNLTYESLLEQLIKAQTLRNLIEHISEPKLHEYFINQKLSLDRVVLSCLVVEQETLAEELREQIKEGAAFEELARDYSIAENYHLGGRMEPVSRSDLPDDIRASVDPPAQPGCLIGPINIEDRWYLFQLEEIIPAALEGEVKEQLKTEIYQQWLAEKIEAMSVKLQVTQWLHLKTSTR